jgi:hypothetical protein
MSYPPPGVFYRKVFETNELSACLCLQSTQMKRVKCKAFYPLELLAGSEQPGSEWVLLCFVYYTISERNWPGIMLFGISGLGGFRA